MMSSSNRSSLQGSKNVRYLFKCFYWLSNTAAVLLSKRKGNQFDIELLTTSIIAHWLAACQAAMMCVTDISSVISAPQTKANQET